MSSVTVGRILLCLVLAFSSSSAHSGEADRYPERLIRLIVPFPAANATDALARLLADELRKSWGQPVIVENIVGGGGVIGMRQATTAPRDGYTLCIVSAGLVGIVPALYKTPPYDVAALTAISMIAPLPLVLLTHPSVPADSVQELLELARQKPGSLPYASLGPGSAQNLAMVLLNQTAGTSMLHVPYKGSSQAKVDFLAGRISTMFEVMSAAIPDVKAGSLKALAVTGGTRFPLLPDIPTVAEAGMPGYELTAWVGLMAPRGTPSDIVAKLNSEVVRILTSPEVKAKALSQSQVLTPSTTKEFGEYIDGERVRWRKIVRDAGVEFLD